MSGVLTYTLETPPFLFSLGKIGLVHIAPLVGAAVGMFLGGYFCDKWIYRMSRKHKGIFEPEFRLVCMLPIYISGPLGLIMFGFGIDQHWSIPVFAFGIGMSFENPSDESNVHTCCLSQCG